jgi:hypothetical protein
MKNILQVLGLVVVGAVGIVAYLVLAFISAIVTIVVIGTLINLIF